MRLAWWNGKGWTWLAVTEGVDAGRVPARQAETKRGLMSGIGRRVGGTDSERTRRSSIQGLLPLGHRQVRQDAVGPIEADGLSRPHQGLPRSVSRSRRTRRSPSST